MTDRDIEFVAIPVAEDDSRAVLGIRVPSSGDCACISIGGHGMMDDVVLIEMIAAAMNAAVHRYDSERLN